MTETVLAVLNQPSRDAAPHDPAADAFTWAKPLEEHVQVQDLGITRGDGVFETITVIDGRPQALEAHLARFGRSAAMLDLPAPDPEAWRQAIEAVCARLDPVREAFAKTVLTRGVEGTDRPTGWVYAAPSGDSTAARTEGISVVDAGPRVPARRRAHLAVAAAGREDAVVRREHGRPARGRPPRRRRRPVRLERRLRARGHARQPDHVGRRPARHAAHRHRDPRRHDAGRRVPLRRAGGHRDRLRARHPRRPARRRTRSGSCRACGRRRRSVR